MGILTLLRNAFGRSRKGRAAEAEGADSTPSPEPTVPSSSPEPQPTATPQVPEPRRASHEEEDREHDLVAAAFDKVAVPRPAQPADAAEPAAEPAAEVEVEVEGQPAIKIELEPLPTPTPEPEPATEPKPETETPAETEPAAEAQPEAETAAETEPEAETEAATATEPEAGTAAETEPVAEAEPEPAAEVTPEPEPKPEAEAEPEPTPEAEPKPEVEAVAESDTDTAPEPEAEPTTETAPEPEAVAEPEPETAPEPEAEAEPTAEATPEAEPTAEATPEPEPEAAAQPEAAVQPEPEAIAEPEAEAEAVAEPEAETEPVGEATPEPITEPEPAPQAEAPQTDEPTAADGEDAPQGPPAPDDESSTGGAGGNEPAEGEAEATPQPAAEPATPLTHVETHAPGLLTAYHAATAALGKSAGTRAKLYLVLDRSASMRPYYKDGSAQALAEQTLALAAHVDPEATLPVVFFSTEVDGTGELTLTEHENKIDDLHAGLGRMGRTSYHAAVEAVLALHDKTADPTAPALVVFQTDGAPDAKTPATQSLTEAAKTHPGVFFSFVAFGEHDNKAFDYLRKLKTDNASFFHAGPTPRELTDTELYEGVLANWRP
ncbi:VWA domain-containing protein [Streptomyces sp. NPDC004542]|uniref:VWA domain-containing protein n=1 Tax=Streptomyces sp. NPDC004542 TaxID=3154281 RepID=UPI0033B04E57